MAEKKEIPSSKQSSGCAGEEVICGPLSMASSELCPIMITRGAATTNMGILDKRSKNTYFNFTTRAEIQADREGKGAGAVLDLYDICKPLWIHERNKYVDVIDQDRILRHEKHAAHVVLWCEGKETDRIVGENRLKHRILMQTRFDGSFGFPGGLIDEVADRTERVDFNDFVDIIKIGLKREVKEEFMFDFEYNPAYLYTSISKWGDDDTSAMLHCFVAKIPLDTMEKIESNFPLALTSDEVLGLTRVPLYILKDPHPERSSGLPTFLTNAFAGNSLEQLLRSCRFTGILSEYEIAHALRIAGKIITWS